MPERRRGRVSEGWSISLDVATTLDEQNHRPAAAHPRTVNRAWLETLPADGLTAMVSLAIDPDPAAWDRAFAVADRVERIDPARAGLAPLRTRLNLLAAGAGVKLEADVRPHVRGVTIGVFGDPDDPGRVSGGLIVLHLDGREAAERLVRQSADRIGAGAGARAVSIRTRDRDIRIAWGDAVRAQRDDRPARDHSLAAVCGDWAAEGCGPPVRRGLLAGTTLATVQDADRAPPCPSRRRRRSAGRLVGLERAGPRARSVSMDRAAPPHSSVSGGLPARPRPGRDAPTAHRPRSSSLNWRSGQAPPAPTPAPRLGGVPFQSVPQAGPLLGEITQVLYIIKYITFNILNIFIIHDY